MYILINVLGPSIGAIFLDLTLEMELIKCAETSVTEYQCALRNISQEESNLKVKQSVYRHGKMLMASRM